MNLPELPLDQAVLALLTHSPSLSALDLQHATGKSQASISLALTRLGSAVIKLGAARSTRYARTHPILGLDTRQIIRLAGPHPDEGVFGDLRFLHGDQMHVRGPGKSTWLCQKALPWWLSTLRPQGFLGRQYARLRPDFPVDPDHWSLPQTLYMAANHFHDPPGAFSIGSYTAPPSSIDVALAHRSEAFDKLADASALGLPAGSSAGGEQPKFLCRVEGSAVVVKFSPPRGTPFGERWHDLLQLEHLANTLLLEHGVPSAQTELVSTRKRTYLQSIRFDRIGANGKRHVVAAAPVHEAFVKATRRHWVATAEALVAQKLLTTEHLRSVACIYLFGQAIGNTDMHFGNLSFFVDDVTRPVFVPTPVYDMLPMVWRPGVHGGELELTPIQPQHQPTGFEAQAQQAHAWAIEFWERSAQLSGLGNTMREACAANARGLQRG